MDKGVIKTFSGEINSLKATTKSQEAPNKPMENKMCSRNENITTHDDIDAKNFPDRVSNQAFYGMVENPFDYESEIETGVTDAQSLNWF